ncbi:MAG: hypothetical protein NT007_10620 [Candidatus Kapabacteria bacterium]|nr:hypothetical protein [Candidatus Kapabacteria bacterium]
MKKILIICFFSFLLLSVAKAEDITLFDKNGEAIAYIAMDQEMTIYMWDGEPVAYLVKKGPSENPKVDLFSIFGYNGKLLGWIKDGILRDKDGNATGFIKGAVNLITNMESMKSMKSMRPMKSMKEMEPMQPMFTQNWSDISLKYFLEEGKD